MLLIPAYRGHATLNLILFITPEMMVGLTADNYGVRDAGGQINPQLDQIDTVVS